MIDAAYNIIEFMKGKSQDDLIKDKILFYAVVKNIEIMGEAANMLTREFKLKFPEINWHEITGMRHVLVHEYFHISPLQVYKVYTEDIPNLLPFLENLKKELEK